VCSSVEKGGVGLGGVSLQVPLLPSTYEIIDAVLCAVLCCAVLCCAVLCCVLQDCTDEGGLHPAECVPWRPGEQ
jgi:hypothetical protein